MNALMFIILIIIIVILAILVARMTTAAASTASVAIIVGAAAMSQRAALAREYERWAISRAQVDMVIRGMDQRGEYEARAILERWNIAAANFWTGEGMSKDDKRKHEITAKMRGEFLEKGLFTAENVDAIIDKMFAQGSDESATLRPGDAVIISGGVVRVGKFTKNLPRERIALLLEMAARAKVPGPESLAIAALRYASLVSGGQQWSIPASIYDVLVEKFGATIEGFASPFNSQILRHARERDVHYCSLFADTDAVFGSVGNYFDYNFEGATSVINPPYVTTIMNAVANKSIETCEKARAPTRMFVVVPNWTDAEFYAHLSGAPCLEKKFVHGAFETFYEDVNQGGKPIVASFGTTMFVLSGGGAARDIDYAPLEAAFAPPAEIARRGRR